MQIGMEGFRINIGGRTEAVWDGSRATCPYCGIQIGVARYKDSQEIVRFSLLSNNAEPHDCGTDIDRQDEVRNHENRKHSYRQD